MTRALTAAAIAVCATVATIGAQTATPTVDQILQKQIDAMGGRAAIEKVTSITARGTLSVPDAGVDGTIELFQKAPNKVLSVTSIQGQQQREGFDGTIGWAEDPQNGLREKSGVELAEARRSAAFGRELQMQKLFPKMTVLGREKVGAREAWVVEAVPAEGAPTRYFFDAESGLLIRQLVTRQTPGGPLQVDVSFEDYRDVDGVKRPFVIRQVTPVFTAIVQLTEVKQNVALDDKMFSKPAGR